MQLNIKLIKSSILSLSFWCVSHAHAALEIQKTDIKLNKQWEDLNTQLFHMESKSNYHNDKIDFKNGLTLAKKALKIANNHDNKLAIAYSYNNLAMLLWINNEYDEALVNANKALQIVNTLFDEKNLYHVDVLHTIGNLHMAKENFESANKYFLEASQITKSLNDKNKSNENRYRMMLINDSLLEWHHLNQSSTETIISTYKNLIEKFGDLVDSDGYLYTSWVDGLAEEYRYQEQFDKAYELQSQNLKTREKTLDPNHKDLGVTYNNMALLYYGNKISKKKSLNFINKSLAILKHNKAFDSHSGYTTRLNKVFIVTDKNKDVDSNDLFIDLLMEVEAYEAKHPNEDWIADYKKQIIDNIHFDNK